METTLINNAVYDLIDEIKDKEIYKEYIKYKEKIKNLEEFKNFNKLHTKIINLKGGKYHPDYKSLINNFIEVKIKYLENENILKYYELEKEIQKIMDSISRELGKAISNEIKIPNEFGVLKCK